MGHIVVRVRVGPPSRERLVEVEGLVDTGATLTVIPRKVSNEIGLEIVGKTVIETGAGRLELDRSRAWIEIEGRGDVIPVLVSDVIDKLLIGVTTLEILGLQVDPITGKLKEWTLLLY
ncbi:MAG: aspartyl protease family protein [Aigarchaeota archaeon]|nr:aspartyl protease family protein [Candidatus Geocrenenecus dongiae]